MYSLSGTFWIKIGSKIMPHNWGSLFSGRPSLRDRFRVCKLWAFYTPSIDLPVARCGRRQDVLVALQLGDSSHSAAPYTRLGPVHIRSEPLGTCQTLIFFQGPPANSNIRQAWEPLNWIATLQGEQLGEEHWELGLTPEPGARLCLDKGVPHMLGATEVPSSPGSTARDRQYQKQ